MVVTIVFTINADGNYSPTINCSIMKVETSTKRGDAKLDMQEQFYITIYEQYVKFLRRLVPLFVFWRPKEENLQCKDLLDQIGALSHPDFY